QQQGELQPDVVVAIVDASNLERNLYLVTQTLELGVPVVIALNMMDVAVVQGIRIDAERLARQLGVPVVPIQANKGKGLDRLKRAIADAASPALRAPRSTLARFVGFPEAFEREVDQLHKAIGAEVPAFLARRLLLDVGGYTEQRLADQQGDKIQEQ